MGIAPGPVARELARYAAETTYASLPPHVAERAKIIIYDQLACSFVGSELPARQIMARYVDSHRGAPEATIFVLPARRAPAPLAALANGTAGHTNEMDSVHSTSDFVATGYPAPIIVPAAVAVAERLSSTGADLVNAVALGYDIGSRTVSSTGGYKSVAAFRLYAGSFYSVGAAFFASGLLALDERRTRYAAALAVDQGMNGYSFYAEKRHMSKALFTAGNAAFAGVTGAVLASMGFEATEDILQGQGGIVSAWAQPGRTGELVRGLFAVMGANSQLDAAGYPIHSAIEAALSLKTRHAIDVANIVRIQARLPEYPASVVNDRGMPTISLQHMVSVALVAGGHGYDDSHSAALLSHGDVLRLKNVVELTGDPDFEVSQPRGAVVTLHLADGTTLEERVENPKGHRFRDPQTGWTESTEKWGSLLTSRIGEHRIQRTASCRRATGIRGRCPRPRRRARKILMTAFPHATTRPRLARTSVLCGQSGGGT
jgi:2-methylcitrate dehydratase PrpD